VSLAAEIEGQADGAEVPPFQGGDVHRAEPLHAFTDLAVDRFPDPLTATAFTGTLARLPPR
jgi:hypothetical protein